MRNTEMTVTAENKLVITIDLNADPKESGSGKSLVFGSTEGNVSVPGHEEIKVGLNVYKKK